MVSESFQEVFSFQHGVSQTYDELSLHFIKNLTHLTQQVLIL
jgi:hypothetical protein